MLEKDGVGVWPHFPVGGGRSFPVPSPLHNSRFRTKDDAETKLETGGMMRQVSACVVAAAAGSAGFLALALASWAYRVRGGGVRGPCELSLDDRAASAPEGAALALESSSCEAIHDAVEGERAPLAIERAHDDDDDSAQGPYELEEPVTWEVSADAEECSALDKSEWSRVSSCSFDSNDKTATSESDLMSTDGEAEPDGINSEHADVEVKSVGNANQDTTATSGTPDALATSELLLKGATTLAHRLAPHTTATGRFYIHRSSLRDDGERSLVRTRGYAMLKAQFEAVAREWVLMQSDGFAGIQDDSKCAALEASLVTAYSKLVPSLEFADDQTTLLHRWERANAALNEAAFRVVRSALNGYRTMASTGTNASLVRLNVLEQRLDSLRVLDAMSPRDVSTPAPVVLSADPTKLSLLELRALTHVSQTARAARQQSTSDDLNETEWCGRLRRALVGAKDEYDAHRRLQMDDREDSIQCCTSAQACAFRSSWECAIPIYKAYTSVDLMTAYCDLEAATH